MRSPDAKPAILSFALFGAGLTALSRPKVRSGEFFDRQKIITIQLLESDSVLIKELEKVASE